MACGVRLTPMSSLLLVTKKPSLGQWVIPRYILSSDQFPSNLSQNPIWNFTAKLMVDETTPQNLLLEVYDADLGKVDIKPES